MGSLSVDRVLRVLFFSLAVITLFYFASQHHPWRDEYQSFLVSTRTESFLEFWTAIRYERTPPLHYFAQRLAWPLFEGRVEPREFIRWITFPFSILSFFLLFFRLRLPLVLAVSVSFGIFFIREWGMISRTYALGAALLLLGESFRIQGKVNRARFWIALSASTHLLFFLLAASLLLLDFIDDLRKARLKSRWLGWIFICSFFVFLLFQQWPPSDSSFTTSFYWQGFRKSYEAVLISMMSASFPIENGLGIVTRPWSWNVTIVRLGWLAFYLPALLLALISERRQTLRWFVLSAPILLVFCSAQAPSLRHTGVLFLALVLALLPSIQVPKFFELKSLKRMAIVFLVSGPLFSTAAWLYVWNPIDPHFDWSDAPSIVEFMRKAKHIYVPSDYLVFSAMAESGRNVYDLSRDREVAYPYFRRFSDRFDLSRICVGKGHPREGVPSLPVEHGDLYIQSAYSPDLLAITLQGDSDCKGWVKIYETLTATATDEAYVVYRFEGY